MGEAKPSQCPVSFPMEGFPCFRLHGNPSIGKDFIKSYLSLWLLFFQQQPQSINQALAFAFWPATGQILLFAGGENPLDEMNHRGDFLPKWFNLFTTAILLLLLYYIIIFIIFIIIIIIIIFIIFILIIFIIIIYHYLFFTIIMIISVIIIILIIIIIFIIIKNIGACLYYYHYYCY